MFDPGHPVERGIWGLHLLPLLLAPWLFGANRDWIWPWLLTAGMLSTVAAILFCRFDARRHQHIQERGRLLGFAWLTIMLLLVLSLVLAPWLGLADVRASLRTTLMLGGMGLHTGVLGMLCHSRRRLRWTLMAIFINGAVLAMTGLAVALSGLDWSLLGIQLDPVNVARAPFINRNHFAGYLAICGALGFGLLCADLNSHSYPETWGQRFRNVLVLLLSRKLFVRTLLVVIVIGLIVSQSRMGNLAFGLALAVVGAVAVWRWRPLPPGLVPLVASIFVIDVLLAGSWFGLDRLQQRFRETTVLASAESGLAGDSLQIPVRPATPTGTEPSDSERVRVAASSFKLLSGHWLLGVGVGGYRAAFGEFKPDSVLLHYQHAHNDWVQTLVERGLLGMLMVLATLMFAVHACLRVLTRRDDKLLRGSAVGLLTAYAVVGTHALADFNLQIPAYLWLVHVLLALSVNVLALPERSMVKLS
ncbi:hypothetical protein C7S18_09190 [Ahniella affigens]|uniref:O-antigen ligase-related domain-containing protein n=1 Tax=Ahniella affigens TaxID=2021234 RepID=A0A2P1PR75_9GAMM|nr:O-antigen ligase family protein [Ahniella affigens]AVP97356.1 hypothetical protein C7S18_09190 [Ahniella affigens]